MKSASALWIFLSLVACSCTSVRAPMGSVPTRAKLETEAYGGWIGMTLDSGVLVQGELVAISNDSIYYMNETGFQTLAISEANTARLITYKTSPGGFVAWTFFGSLFTLTNGGFAAFTLPMTLISGISTTVNEVNRVNYIDYPASPLEQVSRYARFPQGLPVGLDRSVLRVRSPATRKSKY